MEGRTKQSPLLHHRKNSLCQRQFLSRRDVAVDEATKTFRTFFIQRDNLDSSSTSVLCIGACLLKLASRKRGRHMGTKAFPLLTGGEEHHVGRQGLGSPRGLGNNGSLSAEL